MISIIIINYNTRDLTEACIRSVLNHTSGCECEIILVDNASTECPSRYFSDNFPDITVVGSPVNLGFAGGNNLGIQHARGDEFVLLNSDAELLNDAISITSNVLRSDPDTGIVTCKLLYPDGRIQHNCQSFPDGIKYWTEKLRLHLLLPRAIRSKIMQGSYFDYSKSGKPDWVWGTYFHFRKSVLDRFSERKLFDGYFMYVEDMEWCYQARSQGWEIRYEPSAQILHHSGGSSGPRSAVIQKNYEDFINRNYSKWRKLWMKSTGLIS